MRRILTIASIGLALGAAAFIAFTARPAREAAPAPPVEAPGRAARPPAPAPTPAPPPEPSAAALAPPSSRPAGGPSPPPAAPAPPAAPEAGTLRIDADVPGAQVFIDRQYLGTTPLTAENVSPGTHRLNASAAGYEGLAETIEVAPGSRDIVMKFREVRLNVSLDVVHKHRFGSCEGRLLATPAGLRYDTVHADDAFSGALADLEAFDVDYLKKNLRVTLTRGRRYDFTDPQGNADRLFVFHRDVAKARDRLAKGDPPASN